MFTERGNLKAWFRGLAIELEWSPHMTPAGVILERHLSGQGLRIRENLMKFSYRRPGDIQALEPPLNVSESPT